jgi:tetratricopeptide (TPR) repeat protein
LNPVGAYENFLQHTPDMDQAREVIYHYALALTNRGAFQLAADAVKKLLTPGLQEPARRRAESLLGHCLNSLILSAYGRGDDMDVAQLFVENKDFLLRERNGEKGRLLLVAESLVNLGLLASALDLYAKLKPERDVPQDYVLFQLGRVLSMNGDWATAMAVLKRFPEAFPRSPYLPETQKLLGDLSFDQKDYGDAIRWYRQTIAGGSRPPGIGRIYWRLGQALKAKGLDKEAMEMYQKAVDTLWPLNDQPWTRKCLSESLAELATDYEDHGALSQAIECYRKIVQSSSSEDQKFWALYRLGESYRKSGNMTLMQQAFEDLAKGSSGSLWARLAARSQEDLSFEAKLGGELGQVKQTAEGGMKQK